MTDAQIIDGKAFAAALRGRVAAEAAGAARRDHGLVPGLAVVLVGEDPASQVYVRNKGKQTVEAGMASFEHKLPADDQRRPSCSTLVERAQRRPARPRHPGAAAAAQADRRRRR